MAVQAAAAAKNPITVVMFTATPLDISALLSNPKVGAVLHDDELHLLKPGVC